MWKCGKSKKNFQTSEFPVLMRIVKLYKKCAEAMSIQMPICFSLRITFVTRLLKLIIIINPSTARVVGAPKMILQPVFSIFPCSPLPSGTCQTPGLSIPGCCLPTSSSVCLVLFKLEVTKCVLSLDNVVTFQQ